MAESKLVQLNIENSSSVYIQYAMPWLHCDHDIRSCCRQSLHVFTSRYDSILLDCIFFTPNVFYMRLILLRPLQLVTLSNRISSWFHQL